MIDDSPPTSARRLETRARLIDAAAQVFVDEGLRGAAVESICARAGFTRGAFYSNFASKEELFLAALAREQALQAERMEQKAAELLPELRDGERIRSPEEIAGYVSDFLGSVSAASEWYALESEFRMLSARDPELGAALPEFITTFGAQLATLVEELIDAAGRTFLIPVERAMAVFNSIYERALRVSAVAGPAAPEGIDELGSRITELLFVITTDAHGRETCGTSWT